MLHNVLTHVEIEVRQRRQLWELENGIPLNNNRTHLKIAFAGIGIAIPRDSKIDAGYQNLSIVTTAKDSSWHSQRLEDD